MRPAKRPESVLVVVHDPGGRILLLRRRRPADFWQSVTGSLEAGETPVDAARREVGEETGLDPAALVDCRRSRRFAIAPAWQARYGAGVTHNLEHEFRLQVAAGAEPALDPGEHAAAVWLEHGPALARATSWTNRAAIRMLPLAPGRATVVLVHGLWLGSPSMALLARRLHRAGLHVRRFAYSSTRESPPAAAARLERLVAGLPAPVVHFAAHSLGGLVLAELFRRGVPPATGRSVLLGAPMQASVAATGLRRLGLDWTLGAAGRRGLLAERPAWAAEVPVATIVGDRPLGLGRLVARMPAAHDGAVAVEETIVPGAPRVILPVTHSGLLVNRAVAARCTEWLLEARLTGSAAGSTAGAEC